MWKGEKPCPRFILASILSVVAPHLPQHHLYRLSSPTMPSQGSCHHSSSPLFMCQGPPFSTMRSELREDIMEGKSTACEGHHSLGRSLMHGQLSSIQGGGGGAWYVGSQARHNEEFDKWEPSLICRQSIMIRGGWVWFMGGLAQFEGVRRSMTREWPMQAWFERRWAWF
jgi:hypothetical protein